MDRRRGTRIPPKFHASEEGAGAARRRSTRLHPRIQASEDSTGVACRRSPRLRPQNQACEEGAGTTRRIRRRRGTSPAAAVSLPDDDDMLREILARLPPQPSSLPRASAVCKRWRGLVTDPRFLRQFYAHHRKPPLLGVFNQSVKGIMFTRMLDPPNRIPPRRFSLGRYGSRKDCTMLDCRHGLVLVKDPAKEEVVVCDPITREQRRVAIPPELKDGFLNGAVLCAVGDLGHVHGGCHSSPFKVVLISTCTKDNRQIARVYSSEIGIWGNIISIEASCVLPGKPAVLVGNRLYWLSMTSDILEFYLDENSLNVISGPPITNDTIYENRRIIRAEDGAVGYAIFRYDYFQLWKRNTNDHGATTWVRWKSIEMHTIIGHPSETEMRWGWLTGYDEDNDVVFLRVGSSVYMVQLKSTQSRKLQEINYSTQCYPFTSFYTPGGGSNRAEMLHDT